MKIKYALEEAFKFTFWIVFIMSLVVGLAVGTLLAVDCLPLIEAAKIILTAVLWTIEICFVVAFFASL